MQKYLIAYDIDCGPCNKFKKLVDTLDLYNNIDFVSIFEADSKGLLKSIPPSKKYESFHLIFPTGKTESGSDAIIDLISIFPLGQPISKIIRILPANQNVIRYIYYLFSRLRDYSSCKTQNNPDH
ncbi:MAG TPA: DCC1-like thiol-disulfide oxidoreductase family protein [Verrucomicrobiae bacterium]|nr:DCC1-like thiol-disulfide oxidoreductase family protein [Verrucomicrobiae bacterium]